MPETCGYDSPATTTERALIARILARDPVAERTFYDAHVDDVYRLALRMVQDDALAQDCTQETFIRAFDRIGQVRSEGLLGAWLHRVAVSVVLNTLKRGKRQWATELPCDETVLAELPVDPGPAECHVLDLPAQLNAALAALPTYYRDVVVLHDLDGHTHQSIATRLGITVTTSKVRLSRARSRLRLALAAYADAVQ